MNSLKSGLIFALFVLFVVGSASASGQADQSGEIEKVTISMTYATGDPLTKEKTHEVIQNFQKENPDIDVIENLSMSTGAYLDSLKTLNAAGQFPDIFECRDTPIFVRADMLQPLSDHNRAMFDNPVSIYGDVYTAPYVANLPYGIVYNKTFFREHGINESPQTYGEFLEICEDVKAAGMAPIVSGISDIWHMGFWFGKFWADFIGVKNPNWIADRYAGNVHFSDGDFKSAMEKLVDLYQKGYVEGGFMSTKESQCISVLVANKAAMYYIGPWAFTQISEADPDFEYGFFPIPDDKGNFNLIGGASSAGWAITKKAAADPKKVEAYNRFLTYFFEKEGYTEFLKTVGSASTTAEAMPYETSGAMTSLLQAYNDRNSKKSLNWNQGVGANEMPSAFRNWTYKKIQEAILDLITVDELVADMDKEWEVQSRDFNPTKLTITEF